MKNTIEKYLSALTSSKSSALMPSLKCDLSNFSITPLYLRQGLTKENMEDLYLIAHHLYENNNYQKACPLFELMAFLNHTDKRAWLGTAACFEGMQQYSEAIKCYSGAAMVDENDPMPFFRIFNCYLKKKDKENAIIALDAAIAVADKQPEIYATLKNQAINIKEALLK